MLQFVANLVFARHSCCELHVIKARSRRTKIKWPNLGADLSLHANGTVWLSSRYMCISVMFVMDYIRAGE